MEKGNIGEKRPLDLGTTDKSRKKARFESPRSDTPVNGADTPEIAAACVQDARPSETSQTGMATGVPSGPFNFEFPKNETASKVQQAYAELDFKGPSWALKFNGPPVVLHQLFLDVTSLNASMRSD